ncbi:MAG: cytochrome b [Stappiaceae bacterium]
MSARSLTNHYGSVAITIHWISALLIVALLASGFRAANSLNLDDKSQLLSIHAPLGIAIFVLTLGRLLWWLFFDRKPDAIAGMPKVQTVSARAVHGLFYLIIFGMVASGITMFALSGAGKIIFGGEVGKLPDFQDYGPRLPHGIGARLMIVLLIFHTGAALYHHFVKKDGLLRRMWY